jgi:adenine phosphoribosyltransferase
MNLDAVIRKVPNFPKPGILFYDVTTIFTHPAAFAYVIDQMVDYYKDFRIDGVVAIESRGFLVAGAYCCRTGKPLVLARKKGKLPGKTISQSYALEYGEATLEMHTDDIVASHRYLIIDDLVATGGTIEAVAAMLTRQNAQVAGVFSIIGLPFLPYKSRLAAFDVKTLVEYHGETA